MDKLKIMWAGPLDKFERVTTDLKAYCFHLMIPVDRIVVLPYLHKTSNTTPVTEINMATVEGASALVDSAIVHEAKVIALPYGWPVTPKLENISHNRGVKLIMACPTGYPTWSTKCHKIGKTIDARFVDSTPEYHESVDEWQLILASYEEICDGGKVRYTYAVRDIDPDDFSTLVITGDDAE